MSGRASISSSEEYTSAMCSSTSPSTLTPATCAAMDFAVKGTGTRLMNDLAHAAFINKLEYVASKYGVVVHKIDRWYASSKTCECGYVNKSLQLIDREWVCPECGSINHRDLNAAKNILRKGISELESMGKTSSEASCVCTQESHLL